MTKIDRKPLFSSLPTLTGSSAIDDADLIFKVLVHDHGLNRNRYSDLNRKQKDYIECLICTLVQNLVSHLEQLLSL